MNSAAISVLAEAGIRGKDADIVLRRLLSALITPDAAARKAVEGLGLSVRSLDPSLRSIPEIVRQLADAGLDEPAAKKIFGKDGAQAILVLVRRVERLEKLQNS